MPKISTEAVTALAVTLQQHGIDTQCLSINVCEACNIALCKQTFRGTPYHQRYLPQIAGMWVTSALAPMRCMLCQKD